MHIGTFRDRRIIITLIVVVVLLVATIVVVLVRHLGSSKTTTLGGGGGTATSSDGQVSVTFSPGELGEDTSVEVVNDDRSAPLPPIGIVPATQPFSITPKGNGGHRGRVTVQYPELPDGVDPSTLVMMVSEGSGWMALETVVDPETHTVFASWPHFSWGFVGVPGWVGDGFNTVKNGTQEAAQWGWDNVQDGLSWVGNAIKELGTKLTAVGVGMLGGTLAHPECEHPAEEWRVAAQAPTSYLPSALEACIEEKEPDGSWKMKVVNHFPFPYMLKLPPNVSVNWDQLVNDAGYPIEDAVIATVEGMVDRTMVYGGRTLEIVIDGDADPSLDFDGFIDPVSIGLKAVMVALTIFTAGEATAAMEGMHSALDLEIKALVQEQVRSGSSLMSELVSRELWNNAVQRSIRAEEIEKTVTLPGAADLLFTMIDLVNCGLGVYNHFTEEEAAPPVNSSEDLGRRVNDTHTESSLGRLVNECFTAAAMGVFRVLKLVNPASSVTNPEELVKALCEQVLSAIRVSMTQTALQTVALTGINYVQTGLHLQRSEEPAEPEAAEPEQGEPTAESSAPSPVPESSTPTPLTSVALTEAAPQNIPFQTTGDNIFCGFGENHGLMCYTDEYDFSALGLKTGTAGWACGSSSFTVNIGQSGGLDIATCAPDYIIRGTQNPAFLEPGDLKTLAYGASVQYDGIQCTSNEDGLRCTNADGHGFALSRAAFSSF